MNNVIPFVYQDKKVSFDFDGWINATEIALKEGRRIDRWLSTKETQDYIKALSKHLNTTESGYFIKTYRGRNGGTWLHPKLAVAFARWISADFAVWCDLKIDALVRGDLQVKENYSSARQALLQAKQQASKSGADLASWRWSKGSMQQQVEYWGGQLSLMLQGQSDDYEGF